MTQYLFTVGDIRNELGNYPEETLVRFVVGGITYEADTCTWNPDQDTVEITLIKEE